MTKLIVEDDLVLTFDDIAESRKQDAARHAGGQLLYAKIKETSKYFYQNKTAQKNPEFHGWPFRVHIVAGNPGDPVVHGGPGGRYHPSDVHLFVIEDGQEVQIS